ncbi:uncharacterized protein LOC105734896 [Apis florea]|uniref:uncharacterized protein LOC105734896 n=1 Tax=Apis florea TaxID=7463 RepID=UPI0006297E5B|nr:uncharacterized protein LOC105734896 [Apis florea]
MGGVRRSVANLARKKTPPARDMYMQASSLNRGCQTPLPADMTVSASWQLHYLLHQSTILLAWCIVDGGNQTAKGSGRRKRRYRGRKRRKRRRRKGWKKMAARS